LGGTLTEGPFFHIFLNWGLVKGFGNLWSINGAGLKPPVEGGNPKFNGGEHPG